MSLYQKYRPRKFSEVVGQEDVVGILRNQVRRGRIAHAYLFAGPSGTGKTTIARILATAANCERPRGGEPCLKCQGCSASAWDVVEFDAASYRGIDEIREMQTKALLAPIGKRKTYILDEAHMLTEPAFNALLKFLEEPPPHMVLALCTTAPGRIPETVKSRCEYFTLKPLSPKAIAAKLEYIAKHERVELAPASLKFIAGMADGNMRRAETMLEQVIYLDGGKPSHRKVVKFLQAKLI